MQLLNVNNLSLTSTSESDILTDESLYTDQQQPLRNESAFIATSWFGCDFSRFVGRINIYKDKEEPVARWV